MNINNLLARTIDDPAWIRSVFTMKNMCIVILISLLNGILVLFASQRYMLALQQFGYDGKKYYKWLYNKENNQLSRLTLLCLMCFLFFCVWSLSFTMFFKNTTDENLKALPAYFGFLVYLLFMFAYIKTERAVRRKMPIKGTKRIVRLGTAHVLLTMIATLLVCLAVNGISYLIRNEIVYVLRYGFISFIPVLAPFILLLANVIMKPFEKLNEKRYVRRAKAKLEKCDLIKIGITGSYGKTSVKSILSVILSEKYRVLATPKSYNTPLGISIATKRLDSTHDVFIAEMGAKKKGDITDLAVLVNPDIAVLTGINEQHLETFKDIDTVKATKFELFEHLKKDGKAYFSCDNEYSAQLYEEFEGEKTLAGLNGEKHPKVYAKNIVATKDGSFFTLVLGEKEIDCQTTLLGVHNVSNIVLASSVAYDLGLPPYMIASGINKISATTHRLSILPNNKGIVIIDDSYNSNFDGLKKAIEVVKSFDGRKIIVTPGIVELGDKQAEINEEAGRLIAKAFDKIIVIGKTNAEALIRGLMEEGKTGDDVTFEKNSDRGNNTLNKIIEKGDVVLFENDLPDTYI